ncbi:small-subunit processome [Elsinoe ampelina]|uniref:U3 small nucleolar RNA-associated protein 11 n=1 Tax=Elsinoe ampelina TaxID=302913 RepID=A0A6A6FYY4_9PEZI|nr:small-subunit processome [Elsinoe ampelina]
MSSMRNAVQRRNHKERAQPLERKKWGLLEKHKDYSLRAKDHNVKKARLKALRQKAAERNPDEFAFGMMSRTTKNGVKIQDRGAQNGTAGSMSVDVVKLLKTQDAGYVSTMLQQTKRELEKTREEAVLVDVDVNANTSTDLSKHKRFDEDGNEVAELKDLLDGGSDDDMDDKPAPRLETDAYRAKRKKERTVEMLERKLQALSQREAQLSQALDEVQFQRARMEGTVGGVNRNGVKFKVRERKR